MFRQLDFRSWFTFLGRNRLYTAVNFAGLTLALAFVLLLSLIHISEPTRPY